jgi:exodeoxyribonuclease-3
MRTDSLSLGALSSAPASCGKTEALTPTIRKNMTAGLILLNFKTPLQQTYTIFSMKKIGDAKLGKTIIIHIPRCGLSLILLAFFYHWRQIQGTFAYLSHNAQGGTPMLLLSWNVNGIRAVQEKGFGEFFAKTMPDVLCLQETRLGPELAAEAVALPAGYTSRWGGAHKKGYSGVAIISKKEPLAWREGLGKAEFDNEGRTLTAEFDDFFLIAAYFPNSQHELLRLDYKLAYNKALLSFAQKLRKIKPVIFCGDLNVAHEEKDLARPKANMTNPGFYIDERNWFSEMLKKGYADTFRLFTDEGGHYSWWSYRLNARRNNVGWRIDYFIVSDELVPRVQNAYIMKDVMGIDHCPVALELA